ncbi:hypothetical protein NECAME_06757 [Necator americanus]|uniref:Uncharacterized protein n=1 Tax=Necator americanus TaxID=51031 RepID=W2TUJ4_NECAM|nr:hypothetical protein NECAME_06757 [Necator americanus]ETN84727.1 hypothetical protein NECAME_06757 [Necator americanus]
MSLEMEFALETILNIFGNMLFGSLIELLAQVSYVFTNSNPYLDYPHPTIHKVVNIGGIAVSFDARKNVLPQDFVAKSVRVDAKYNIYMEIRDRGFTDCSTSS